MGANVGELLLQHYVDNSRVLPWRSPPGSPPPDPYRVWLSEIMLQQTTVAAVTPRFERFLKRWPTLEALASAPDSEILSEWAGLGYYARARNLIACARKAVASGGFPDSEAGLRALPGIGDYTAAAIAAIAFGRDAVAVDSNVQRVAARLAGLKHPVKGEVRAFVEAVMPRGRAGDFAQAMMDLGSAICRPRAPLCGQCPLSAHCTAFASGSPEQYPQRAAKAQRPVRHGIAHWIEKDGLVWLVRRPSKGLLGGMAALPGPEWGDEQAPASSPTLAHVRHVFTHFALELAVVASDSRPNDGWWQPIESLGSAGLPTLYRNAAEAVLARKDQLAA